ncbi:HU family DNA-binding protein [Nocardiopsis algeriensis]|uniref:DNA-binding protein HU-beta n=1 Tax=Nocardiopsis algeriensis TaxID=1478215 RepID=A0A841ITS2_9ACTN|nr:HU family DNA-binding protein [Nocardiopsis algeriensis]MBB6121572.1 DNA-binding protein HU-beta [Nocardiopsis algeriensis]
MAAPQTPADPERVTKRVYIASVARRAGLPKRVVSQVYDAAMAELLDVVGRGSRLVLTGFGSFERQWHKGHPVRFTGAGNTRVDDYSVLKFSATRQTNQYIGKDSW